MGDGPDPDPLLEIYEDLYHNAPCGYVTTEAGGTITQVNRTFLGWCGQPREALVDTRRFSDLLSVAGRIYYETHMAPLLRMQGSVSEVALELKQPGGGRLPILVNIVQRAGAPGQVENRITIFNASERRRYERELLEERRRAEAAAQAKADFLSLISHEIRTPLNAIMGATKLLGRTELSDPQQRCVRILRSSSTQLLELVDEVLDFSKIEAGRMELVSMPCDLRARIQETLGRFEVTAQEKGVALVADLDDALPQWLSADPVKLGQVVTNLVSNAIKFTTEGAVTVRAKVLALDAELAHVRIQVSDTGIGMSPEQQTRIFEPFTQADSKVGARFGGTGLGLTISQRLLALHDSALQVESEPGVGTTFTFDLALPLVEAPEDAPAQPSAPVDLSGLHLLVVDDNPVNVFLVQAFLAEWGVTSAVATDGHEALEKVQAEAFDAVLMDLLMPEMDGYEATRRIRALPDARCRQLPIIAVSASIRSGEEDRVKLAGFDDYLGKPYAPEALRARLVRLSSGAPAGSALPTRSIGGPTPAPFTLQGLRRQARGSLEKEAELRALVRAALVEARDALAVALNNRDLAHYIHYARRARPTVELLEATVLGAAIERGRRLLEAARTTPQTLQAAALGIAWPVEDLLKRLDEPIR